VANGGEGEIRFSYLKERENHEYKRGEQGHPPPNRGTVRDELLPKKKEGKRRYRWMLSKNRTWLVSVKKGGIRPTIQNFGGNTLNCEKKGGVKRKKCKRTGIGLRDLGPTVR